VWDTGNAHVTRDHLCRRRIVEVELVELGLSMSKCVSVLFSKLALGFLLYFDKLELRLQTVYLDV